MENEFKKALNAKDLPIEFSKQTRDTIARIEANRNVFGVLYFREGDPQLCTLPETMAKTLTAKIPKLTSTIHRAIIDIDVTDEPLAYRMETRHEEIAVVMNKCFTACVVHKPRDINRTRKSNFQNLKVQMGYLG